MPHSRVENLLEDKANANAKGIARGWTCPKNGRLAILPTRPNRRYVDGNVCSPVIPVAFLGVLLLTQASKRFEKVDEPSPLHVSHEIVAVLPLVLDRHWETITALTRRSRHRMLQYQPCVTHLGWRLNSFSSLLPLSSCLLSPRPSPPSSSRWKAWSAHSQSS